MHENTLGIVTILIKFLINLMFSRLDKFDGPIFKGAYIRGWGRAYIWDVNWATYLGYLRINGIIRHIHKYQVELNNKYISTEKFRVQKSFCVNIFIVYFHLKFFHTYSYCQYIKLTTVCVCVLHNC